MISYHKINWVKSLLSLIATTIIIWCCDDFEKNNENTICIQIENTNESIDREGCIYVFFDLTPYDYIFSNDQVSLYPERANDNLQLTTIENLGNGRYCAFVEDRGLGEPYNVDVSIRIIETTKPHKEIVSNTFRVNYSPIEYNYSYLTNDTVYNNCNHAAFTGLLNFQETLYLAFREGKAHRPAFIEDYGVIKILANDGSGWKECATIKDDSKDLRDPFLIEMDGKMRVYIGYNTFEENIYQHSGSVYSDFIDGKWSDVQPITHDVPHIVWLWKVHKYVDKYYGVAYLEGECPVLLASSDGVVWETVALFQLEGILSEADIAFIGKTMYVCLRKDQPLGSPSYWGVSKYPFKQFEWKEMQTCIESPEMLRMPYSNKILLVGRERHPSSDEVSTTLFSTSLSGDLIKVTTLETGVGGDTGYPSLAVKDSILYCSYYSGLETGSIIKMSKFSFKQQ